MRAPQIFGDSCGCSSQRSWLPWGINGTSCMRWVWNCFRIHRGSGYRSGNSIHTDTVICMYYNLYIYIYMMINKWNNIVQYIQDVPNGNETPQKSTRSTQMNLELPKWGAGFVGGFTSWCKRRFAAVFGWIGIGFTTRCLKDAAFCIQRRNFTDFWLQTMYIYLVLQTTLSHYWWFPKIIV